MKLPMHFKSESVRHMEMAEKVSAACRPKGPPLTVDEWKMVCASGNRYQRRQAEKMIKKMEGA